MFQSSFTMVGRWTRGVFAGLSRRRAGVVSVFFAWPLVHFSSVTLAQMTPSPTANPTPTAAAVQPPRANPATIAAPAVQLEAADTGAAPPDAKPTVIAAAPATVSASHSPGKAARWALALHGGALDEVDKIPAERRRAMEKSLAEALRQGRDLLAAGGSSLDAVERVVRKLEDDPLFNAGKGAVYNAAGGHELDASIMDGRTKACGAVAGVSTVKNPVSLARLVMSRTRHVLLMGAGAEQFADEMKVERVDNRHFDTDYQFERWQRRKAEEAKAKATAPDKKGTVGCVALDQAGMLAAATSTGGLTNKRFGRVGDSPIIGAGTYADNATCAVSCTGTGEEFIRHGVAHDVHARVLYKKQPLAEAVSDVLRKTLQPDDGALIAVGTDGQLVADFNTDGLSRGLADSLGRFEVKLGK
ncbi:MAG: isoaspartyl peptidase/L-asparaginase [Planctomycetota bacterium]